MEHQWAGMKALSRVETMDIVTVALMVVLLAHKTAAYLAAQMESSMAVRMVQMTVANLVELLAVHSELLTAANLVEVLVAEKVAWMVVNWAGEMAAV